MGDITRDKCVELIYNSLALDSGSRECTLTEFLVILLTGIFEWYGFLASDLILKRAKSVEATVLSDFKNDTGREYKGKIRSLYLNLKDKNNPGLRAAVVSGDLSVGKFCRMSSAVRLFHLTCSPLDFREVR